KNDDALDFAQLPNHGGLHAPEGEPPYRDVRPIRRIASWRIVVQEAGPFLVGIPGSEEPKELRQAVLDAVRRGDGDQGGPVDAVDDLAPDVLLAGRIGTEGADSSDVPAVRVRQHDHMVAKPGGLLRQ